MGVSERNRDFFDGAFGNVYSFYTARAVAEIARCLRPHGRALGGMIASGRSMRHRLLVHPGRGAYGPVGTVADLRHRLADAGLQATIEVSGLFAYFSAKSGDEGGRVSERERRRADS